MGPPTPMRAGATHPHLVLIKYQGAGIRQGFRRADLILQAVLHIQTQGRQTSLSSFMKPYLAYYYDNLKNFSDYSFENPICFLCKEETILFSVWEVGTFHLSSGKICFLLQIMLFRSLRRINPSTLCRKKILSSLSYKHPRREAPALFLAIVTMTAFPSLAFRKGNFLLML